MIAAERASQSLSNRCDGDEDSLKLEDCAKFASGWGKVFNERLEV